LNNSPYNVTAGILIAKIKGYTGMGAAWYYDGSKSTRVSSCTSLFTVHQFELKSHDCCKTKCTLVTINSKKKLHQNWMQINILYTFQICQISIF